MKLPELSDSVRVDTGVRQGDEVSIFYDPMIAKLIVWGETREIALNRLIGSLNDFQVVGLPTNLEFLARTAAHSEFRAGGVNTSFLEHHGEPLMTPFGDVPHHAVAVGAATLLLKEELERQNRAEKPSVWTIPSLNSFRTTGTSSRVFNLIDNGKEIALTATSSEDGYDIRVLDEKESSFQVSGKLDASGEFKIRVGELQYSGTVVFDQKAVHLFCNDGTLRKLCILKTEY